MPWKVKLSSQAEKYFKKLDKNMRKRAKKALEELSVCENPIEHQGIKPLTGELKDFYRLRIGGFRIVFALLYEDQIIAVVNFAPRGDVYKN